jgi:hypothetical protein
LSFAKKLPLQFTLGTVMVLTNPNIAWIPIRGTWITNVILAIVLKAVFSVVPGVSPELSWSLTNLTYDIVYF